MKREWKDKGGGWRTRGRRELKQRSATGFSLRANGEKCSRRPVCTGCYHPHFVLSDGSFIQGDMHLLLQGQSATAPASSFSFWVCSVLPSYLTFPASGILCKLVCGNLCVCVRKLKATLLPPLMYCRYLEASACSQHIEWNVERLR